MSVSRLVAAMAVLAAATSAQFSLYPAVDPSRLATAFNISSGCLTALNTTVACDQTLLTMAGTVDNYLWDIDNVTALCTSNCLGSAQAWYDKVNGSCFADTLIFSGKQVPPLTIPGRTLDGLNIACLTPTTDVSLDPGVSGSLVTVFNDTSGTTTSTTQKRDASSSGFCLIDSYDWVGSDIIRPDCSGPDAQNIGQCVDPTNVTADNQRIVNLYPDDLLCSSCFINMFYLRVASPYLPDLDHSDYLVEQYYDIIETCNKQMPDLIVRLTDAYSDAPGYIGGMPVNISTQQPFAGGSTTMAPNATSNGACPGQTITFNQVVNVASTFANPDTDWFCDSLSRSFEVSSGDLIQAFQNYGCDIADPTVTNATWCLPQPCAVYQAPDNSTCQQIVANVATPQSNITVQQLVQYNPNFQGTCDQVPQQYVCITPPGGAYIPPLVSSSTNATQQNRGGGDGSSVVGSGNPAVTVLAGAPAPSPTQPGIISGCVVYSNASVGDGCTSFSQEHGISPSNLFAWNSVLGAGGKYCQTRFWLGYWYCIGTSLPLTSTLSVAPSAPGPTQTDITAACDKFDKAASGDGCESFAAKEGITTAQLYAWNAVLGPNGENCRTAFWANEYYCVHAPGTASSPVTTAAPSTTTKPGAPGPTQAGIISTCNRYAMAVSGDGCESFSAKEKITPAQLYAWNSVLGASGQNCLSSFWAQEYYCVGVSGSSKRHVANLDLNKHGTDDRLYAEVDPANVWATTINTALTSLPRNKRDLPTGTCNAQTPCVNGACCGPDNLCGYTHKQCGTGCRFNCDATAQCGPYAAKGHEKCPLNVCCSEFGFCGSDPEFCTWTNPSDSLYPACSSQYGSCGAVSRPSCGSGGNSAGKRSVGYYESWSNTRACQKVAPEDLNLDGFTSINFAFAFFDPSTFTITPMDSNGASLYARFTALKEKKPGLKTYISVGGWSFTDPGPTQTAFSNMVSSAGNRASFINGLVKFMDNYGFDGVDLDWEYPGADDRGGMAADTANYVQLTKEMRAAFGSRYGLTVTIPTSYWYLQHFDIANMQHNIDWFNLMSYDLHGTWDAQSKFVGPYIAPHTNLTEIDNALDLLWRSGVDSSKVVMGQGWYGRSFTLKDGSCNTPNGVCQFLGGAKAGPCSQAAGILDYQEITDIIAQNHLTPAWDKTAGVKWITWSGNQWVSYDDSDTFQQKRDFANKRCLGGMMVWAMDQVSQTGNNGLSGAAATKNVSPSQQQDANQKSMDSLAGLTCYVSDCSVGCKPGTNEVAQFNGQPGQISTKARCPKKAYRSLCCDSKTQMGSCQWRGYRGAGMSCIKGCASGETELTTNTNQHDGKKGDKNCHGGLQSYCCSNFNPSSSSLEDDLKDAAKAAAEAAAEQAALDVAAKAFCRVAVPALLAPLELLEDLIPIVGEIADAVEIAATPAIIQGCVKGIEKEGKAEFKVFGKKHTLNMKSPSTKPTDVPSRGPPKGDNPSRTGDKGGTCKKKTKVKRAPSPVQTTYDDTPRMKRLVESSGERRDYPWRNGEAYAILLKWTIFNVVPIHYGILAGDVLVVEGPVKETEDECGNIKRTQAVRRDWGSNGFHIRQVRSVTGKLYMKVYTPEKGKRNFLQGEDPPLGMDWIGSIFDSSKITYQGMGFIRPGIPFQAIMDRANAYADKYPDWNLVTNNCLQFANNLKNWMVDPNTALRKREVEEDVVQASSVALVA